MLAVLVGNLMVSGIKKMQGEVFFPDSTIFNIIIGVLGIGFQIRLLDLDFTDRISWGYVGSFLLISLPFFFMSIRKRTVTIYDIAGDKLEKIVLDTFQQYKLVLEKKSGTSEFILLLGESETTIKLEQGTIKRSKWDLSIAGYRKIPNLDLILEDIQKAVDQESIPEMGYRGLMDLCMAAGICTAALWFRRFLYLP